MFEQQKMQATLCYIQSQLIQFAVGGIINKDITMPKIYEVFPGLFTDKEIEENMQQDWRIAKENMMNYSEAFNKMYDKKHQNEGD